MFFINFLTHQSFPPPERKVSFGTTVKVILIPTAAEFRKAGLNLWWQEEDYQQFKQEAKAELDRLIALVEKVHALDDREALLVEMAPAEKDFVLHVLPSIADLQPNKDARRIARICSNYYFNH